MQDSRYRREDSGFRKGILALLPLLLLVLSLSGCRLGYIFHVAAGQFRLLHNSIPVKEALKKDSLSPEQKNLLRLISKIKAFGEKELGLKKTENYETVHMKSRTNPLYTISASPKDRLSRVTWWFPIVGNMPYLGFFKLEKAEEEREKLKKKDLDVMLSVADAYSTLGWFNDPVTLNLLQGSETDLVETILHEMTHTTLYVKGQGEFNEGLAVLVGKAGAAQFLEKTYGYSDPLTIEARNNIEDERIFSSFLGALYVELQQLYNSPKGYQEKLDEREKIFSKTQKTFNGIKGQLKTGRFVHFGSGPLNNAYIMSIGLYHRHFHLFERVFREKGRSVRDTLLLFKDMAEKEGDMLTKARGLFDAT